MPKKIETPPAVWNQTTYYDGRFLSWDHPTASNRSYLYQIPQGDTLKAQITRGEKIVIDGTVPKTTLTLPTRPTEVAIYPTAVRFLAKINNPTALSADELLELVFKERYQARLGLVESQAVIPRVSEAIWLMLRHRQNVKDLKGPKSDEKILNATSYHPHWMLATANRKGSELVKVGNWDRKDVIHVSPIEPNEIGRKVLPAIWIVPKSLKP